MGQDTITPPLSAEDPTPVTNDADRSHPPIPPTEPPATGDDEVGRDAAGTTVRQPGERPINWRRNLYAIFAAQLMAIMAFSMRSPFLPFFLSDLGLHSLSQQQLWSGIV